MALVLVIIVLSYKYNSVSSRELCYVLLSGILMSYLVPYIVLALVLVIIVLSYKYNSVSSRELCYVLLSGILMSYLIPFVVLARPTLLSCAVLR